MLNVEIGSCKLSAEDVLFRNTEHFMAGEIHHHYDMWEQVLEGFHKRDEILNYAKNGVFRRLILFAILKGISKVNHTMLRFLHPSFWTTTRYVSNLRILFVHLSSREFAMAPCPSGVRKVNVILLIW